VKSKAVRNSEPVVISLPFGRDEMNLAEWPTTLLSDHAPDDVKTLRFEDGQGGHLTITGSDAYGLPTASDADVLIGLIQLTKLRNNFTEAKVHFTRYELLCLLNWHNIGKNYRRLNQSLNRWMGVTLYYDGCWYDNRTKKPGSLKMHIIETVVIFDGSGKDEASGSLPLSSFTWNKTFMESCQADNLKRLDLETYFSLRSAISKRIYRFLDKKFYHKNVLEFNLHDFALEHVGLSRSYTGNAGKIKEKLQAALEELEAKGFLEPLAKDIRYRREGRNWIIRVSKVVAPALPAPTIVESEEPTLLGQLMNRGVTKVKAAELVRQHLADYTEAKIEIFDYLVEKKDKRVEKNPAGWLVKAIEDDYPSPKGFKSWDVRAREAEEKQAAAQKAGEERRRKQEDEARERAEKEAVRAYIAKLTPQEVEALDQAARAEADPKILAMETPALAKTFRIMRRDDYVRRLLQEKLPVS
jgi:Replication initiator protein A